jgi:antitoxin HicB
MLIYPVTLSDDEGTTLVEFPDVPEAITYGETRGEALLYAEDALITLFEAYMDEGKPIPTPSSLNDRPGVVLPVLVAGKVALYNAMLAAGKRKADLARMLNLAPTLIDRLLSLRHKSRIEQIETALAVLGKRLVVDVREAA